MRLIRVTFTTITEAHARRDHKISVADHECLTHCVMLIQHRNARDRLANEEQAGNTTTHPDWSAKRNVLPTRSVPRIHATSDASISIMGLMKYRKIKLPHSIGTVNASNIRAPRLRDDPSFANMRI